MKKVLIAFFASLALALTAGGFGSVAQAAYPNTVPTKSSVTTKSKINSGKTSTVRIRVAAGNAKVNDGTVRVRFNGKTYTAKVRNGVATLKIRAPKVKKSVRKKLTVEFKPSGSSVYKSSKASKNISIKAPKKKKKK